jgi:hypothetical protein
VTEGWNGLATGCINPYILPENIWTPLREYLEEHVDTFEKSINGDNFDCALPWATAACLRDCYTTGGICNASAGYLEDYVGVFERS